MNETLDTGDMNITLDAYGRLTSAKGFFGSAPIRAEGEPVIYDSALHEVQDTHTYEVDVAIEPTEQINE